MGLWSSIKFWQDLAGHCHETNKKVDRFGCHWPVNDLEMVKKWGTTCWTFLNNWNMEDNNNPTRLNQHYTSETLQHLPWDFAAELLWASCQYPDSSANPNCCGTWPFLASPTFSGESMNSENIFVGENLQSDEWEYLLNLFWNIYSFGGKTLW